MADTPILSLRQYSPTEDMDYNDINTDNAQVDTLPPTICTSATRPGTNLYPGRMIYETDTKNHVMWDGDSWEILGCSMLLPAPVRGYFITASKSVTATTWTDVASDAAKSITVPKACMAIVVWRAELTTAASATIISGRLAYTGATVGNSYDQMDSGILGGNVSADTGLNRQQYTMTLKLGAGTTAFKLQCQRSNTTNATNVGFAAISVTPIAWADKYDPAAT